MAKKKQEQTCLLYKGIPLVKRENVILYGEITNPFYIKMTILSTEKIDDLEVANKILIELFSQGGRMVKKAERSGMYDAMDIASFWLEDALSA